MPVELPLQEMSFAEKLELLETVWADLSRQPEKLPSPEWHQAILEERLQHIEAGTDAFTDWETAKRDIRKRIS